jgi:hypothetical protein
VSDCCLTRIVSERSTVCIPFHSFLQELYLRNNKFGTGGSLAIICNNSFRIRDTIGAKVTTAARCARATEKFVQRRQKAGWIITEACRKDKATKEELMRLRTRRGDAHIYSTVQYGQVVCSLS